MYANIQKSFTESQYQAKDAYSQYLSDLDWTYFITGSTRYELTLKSTRRLAERWYDAIRLPGHSLLFWVAEKFELKDGFHLHGLLKYPVSKLGFLQLVDTWQWATGNKMVRNQEGKLEFDRTSWNAINIQTIESMNAVSEYCAKYLLKCHSDYDLLV